MTQLDKFRKLLQELFQLDQADLDFGIYRIMNQKRDEVVRFLDKDLLPQVKAAFAKYQSSDKSVIQQELNKLADSIRNAGMKPEDSPKYQELHQKLADSSVDLVALEGEVFSHLYSFFRRYYNEGDFLSLRRYKEGVYAIPYEGEEVKLHWANADQYYVKSSETFRDYTFKVSIKSVKKSGAKKAASTPETAEGRVRFQIVAASTEQDNNKPAAGKERRFVLSDPPFVVENGDLSIRFEYRPADGKTKQEELNQQAIETILASRGQSAEIDPWIDALAELAPTEKKRERTVLEKHLTQFSARNTFDYFIHKDLGGFLRRELDFYIKNEVMHLDNIEHESVPKVEQYLSKIKVIRSIAHKIIQFLEQLENFQKKLWLKKKFVIETNYCITLDRVPEELYAEIAANDGQREEWVRLFAIDKIRQDTTKPGYTNPLTIKFLLANPSLVVDTQYYGIDFKKRLIAAIDTIDGIAICGEAHSCITLIANALNQKIKAALIDPPYNTGNDGFAYKDSYQHSSWYSMIFDRLTAIRKILKPAGMVAVMVDDNEFSGLTRIMEEVFGEQNRAAYAPWRSEPSGGKGKSGLRVGHEYAVVFHNGDINCISFDERSTGELDRRDSVGRYRKGREMRKWGESSLRTDREDMWFSLPAPDGTMVYPVRNDGKQGRWRWGRKNAGMISAQKAPDIFHWEIVPYDLGVIVENRTERWVPFEKIRDEKRSLGWSTWLDEHGTSADGTRDLKDLLGEKPEGATPKPLQLIEWLATLSGEHEEWIIDVFAGSGTTGHAVLNLNRYDGGNRKYLISEMGRHFNQVLVPRLKKAIYSSEWKSGLPTDSTKGSSHTLKYQYLESYEDSLNNLQISRSNKQSQLLDKDADMREQYVLSYMLDVESRGSQSLLNVDGFRNPDEYKLKVERNGETQLVNVDLVETFNWLLGLTVKHIDVIAHKKGGPAVRVVEGTSPTGDRVLVLWRNIDQMDNDALDKWFDKQEYSSRDLEYDLIYVNGDNNLENLRRPDQTWKVRLIEEEFQRLMFDVEDV